VKKKDILPHNLHLRQVTMEKQETKKKTCLRYSAYSTNSSSLS